MKVDVFEDIGIYITEYKIKNILTSEYMSSTDGNLRGMSIASWLIIVIGIMKDSNLNISSISKKILRILNKKNVNTGKVFKLEESLNGLTPIENLSVYIGKENLKWNILEILKMFYTKEELTTLTRNASNKDNINIFNILLQFELYKDFKEIYEFLDDISLLQKRIPDAGNKQATPIYMALSISMDGFEDVSLNPLNVICDGKDLNYLKVFGSGGNEYSVKTSIDNDDLIQFVLSAPHKEIIKVCNKDNVVLSKILKKDIKEELDSYNSTMKSCIHEKEKDKDCEECKKVCDDEDDQFPNPTEKYFKAANFKKAANSKQFDQILAMPALSYYISKYAENSDINVLEFLLEATAPNALCFKDNTVGGISPIAMVAMNLKIVDGDWNSNTLAKFYKKMISTLGTKPSDIYKFAGEIYRMSEFEKKDYAGGMSYLLVEICKKKPSEGVVNKVLPSFVSMDKIINWGKMYGIITEENKKQ